MAFGGYLQANTAVDLMVGPFVDDTDGKTAETGLTITQAEVRLSKNGGNMAQKNEATSLTHDELGNYVCKLDTTDTNTEGILTLMVHESGALPIKMDYMVLAQAAYISHVTAKDAGFMDVNIKSVGRADAQETEANNLESACSNYSVTRGLTGTALPAAVADAAGGIAVSDAGGLDMDNLKSELDGLQGTDGKCLVSTDAQDLSGTLDVNMKTITAGIIANASFNADVGSTAHGTNIIALAVRKILEELNLDHLLKVDTTVAADGDLEAYVVAGTVLAHLMSANKDVTGFKCTTDSLEAIKVHADTIKAETALIVADTNELQADDTPTAISGLDGKLDTIDNFLDTEIAAIVAAVITNAAGADIAADIIAVKAETATIVADTNELQTDDIPGAISTHDGKLDTVDTVVDAIKVVTDNLAAAATTMIEGTVSWDNTNATTTVFYSDDLTEATADHYNGRIVLFTSGALVGQATDITDYALDAGEGKFTVTALTEAPADNVTFVIV